MFFDTEKEHVKGKEKITYITCEYTDEPFYK